jgi:hypothetical protein
MGSASAVRWCVATTVAVTFLISSGPAVGDVTTERGSSILVFPKVQFDPDGLVTDPVNTIIQISNTSNNLVYAHCFYVNSAPIDPTQPEGVFNPPQWQEVDFDIYLTKQQPTHWVVGDGRLTDPGDQLCSRTVSDCPGAGFDPGKIPPVADPFSGELRCIEVDSAGQPLNGNHLKGEATLVTPVGDISKYNAVGIMGLNTDTNTNNGDTTLCLGGGTSTTCPTGAEYNGCPDTVILTQFAENATDPVVQELNDGSIPSRVNTELTLVPCSEDFENQNPQPVTVQFWLTNEFEELFSTSTTITCWANLRLSDVGRVFDVGFLGTRFVQTRLTSPAGQSGFLGVAEEFHQQGSPPFVVNSRAALNLLGEGVRAGGDVIVLPGDQ